MSKKYAALSLLACLAVGCGSFRTTALYRFDNDSVVPECNNEKLKGIPVKLKVPSHVRVNVFEQQVILANTADEVDAKKAAAKKDADAVKETQAAIRTLSTNVEVAKKQLELAEKEVAKRTEEHTAAVNMQIGTEAGELQRKELLIKQKGELLAAANALLTKASDELSAATEAKDSNLAKETTELLKRQAKAEVSAADAEVKYRLVSFTPQQLVVETELDYTDKIFLVDFRRPAAGILNLNEASMDDQQYFSKIQADVTERTLEDVGKALDTLKGTVAPPAATPKAATTGADTPSGEANGSVNFQKSIVASKRFDISEPDWEARMNAFINSKLNSQNGSFALHENSSTPMAYTDQEALVQ
jgi:hypothetical protein